MCGIYGIIGQGAGRFSGEMALMGESLRHRGPDQRGVHAFDGCILGHNRLSIVDLVTGKQPMLSGDGRLGLVFNGEIYGYREIRKGLSYPFVTASDTELILALYQRHGVGLVDRLPGMFAFALWDEEKRQLFCARDRFGEKPFYYAFGRHGEFVFASEIKGILSSGVVEPELDPEAVSFYLRHLYVHPQGTIYRNIHALPPAHRLTWCDGKVSVSRYWQQPRTAGPISLEDAAARFRELFRDAVKKQLVADVPVGAFLSGGLDSSTVVAVGSEFCDRLKTFSFGFGDTVSELPYAREIAHKYGTDHVEVLDDQDIAELLLKMDQVYDEPFADSSNLLTYLIAKMAGSQVKVVLTGDGGDEMLGGYGCYKPFLYAREYGGNRKVKGALLHLVSRAVLRLSGNRGRSLSDSLKGISYGDKFPSVVEAHLQQNNVFKPGDLALLGLSGTTRGCGKPAWASRNDVDDAIRTDLDVYLPGDILTKIDRASMANSIELRAPFLDVDLASFCISLPYALKISRQDDKILLREAFSAAWTESIRTRKKQGFGAPVGKWLKRRSVVELKESYLNDSSRKIFGLVSFERSRAFARKDNYQTWALLVLAIWMENRSFSWKKS